MFGKRKAQEKSAGLRKRDSMLKLIIGPPGFFPGPSNSPDKGRVYQLGFYQKSQIPSYISIHLVWHPKMILLLALVRTHLPKSLSKRLTKRSLLIVSNEY